MLRRWTLTGLARPRDLFLPSKSAPASVTAAAVKLDIWWTASLPLSSSLSPSLPPQRDLSISHFVPSGRGVDAADITHDTTRLRNVHFELGEFSVYNLIPSCKPKIRTRFSQLKMDTVPLWSVDSIHEDTVISLGRLLLPSLPHTWTDSDDERRRRRGKLGIEAAAFAVAVSNLSWQSYLSASRSDKGIVPAMHSRNLAEHPFKQYSMGRQLV